MTERAPPTDAEPAAERPLDLATLTTSLVESIRDYAVFMLDTTGRVITWNSGAARINGYQADEILGQHISVFYPDPDEAREHCRRELELATTEGRFEEEGWRVRKDGSSFWANVVITPVRDTEGRLIGFAKVTRDLTERREADQALRDSEERLRLLIGSIQDYAIFMLDLDGRVMSWNPGACRIKGYRPEEIIGQPIERFYPAEDAAAGKPRRLLERAARDGRVEDVGWRVRKDGTHFWADVVISAVRDESGTLRGFVKVTRDLTELHRASEALRESEDRYRIILESVSDYAIFMLDTRGRIATWNTGAERITGYTETEILGRPLSVFYPPDAGDGDRAERELQSALRSGRFDDEAYRVRKDGSRFWASISLTPIFDASGRHRGFAKVTRDLTDRRALEQERLRLAHAQEALRLRDDFISLASHELRTPLTSLQLQLQALVRRRDELPPWLSARLDRATRSADRLSALVESLLDVSRIRTGHLVLELQEFDLCALAAEVVEELRLTAERAGSEVHLHAPDPVVGQWDRLRVGQVLTNLLGNALRYGAGSRVDVEVAAEHDAVVMRVRDHGPGFPESELPRLFDRFERATQTAHHGGLGLGLYVSREVALAHGGEMRASNAAGGGAIVEVRLPRVGLPGADAASDEPCSQDVHG